MLDPIAAELAARAARRVAVYGTRYSVDSGFFGLLPNVEFIRPHPDEVDLIHSIYAELLRDGFGSTQQHETLTTLAHTLRKRDAVDIILIAGTDLSLLFNESNTAFPHIDCAAVHLDAILKVLLADSPPAAQ
jgi:aspartate racemase